MLRPVRYESRDSIPQGPPCVMSILPWFAALPICIHFIPWLRLSFLSHTSFRGESFCLNQIFHLGRKKTLFFCKTWLGRSLRRSIISTFCDGCGVRPALPS